MLIALLVGLFVHAKGRAETGNITTTMERRGLGGSWTKFNQNDDLKVHSGQSQDCYSKFTARDHTACGIKSKRKKDGNQRMRRDVSD
jgi:hypothetical protein